MNKKLYTGLFVLTFPVFTHAQEAGSFRLTAAEQRKAAAEVEKAKIEKSKWARIPSSTADVQGKELTVKYHFDLDDSYRLDDLLCDDAVNLDAEKHADIAIEQLNTILIPDEVYNRLDMLVIEITEDETEYTLYTDPRSAAIRLYYRIALSQIKATETKNTAENLSPLLKSAEQKILNARIAAEQSALQITYSEKWPSTANIMKR